MKNQILLLCLCSILFILPACEKDCEKDADHDDLTGSIVGLYSDASSNTQIVVNKLNNNTVTIDVSTEDFGLNYEIGFTAVTMNSKTTFTLNEITQDPPDECFDVSTYSGSGTHSGNNISLFINVLSSNLNGQGSSGCDDTFTLSVSASR